jgi:hypothetical protein
MDEIDEAIEELTLLLLYLTAWEEKGFPDPIHRSWKGYPFETLDALEAKNYLSQSKRAKSVYLTDEGVQRAEELRRKYLGSGRD